MSGSASRSHSSRLLKRRLMLLILKLAIFIGHAEANEALPFSVEVPALRFNDVDVQVRNIDVTCAQALGRELARIGAAAGVGDLVAASMRQWESRVAAADGRQLGGKINQPRATGVG